MGAPELLRHLQAGGFVLEVTQEGGVKVTPASALAPQDRQAIKAHKPELLALLLAGDSPSPEHSQALNHQDPDDRVTCLSGCKHYRAGHCHQHRKAGLASPFVGNALANLRQRCPAFMKATS